MATSEFVTNTGMKAGICSVLWKQHKLTKGMPKYKDDEITREESEEFLNWTAQMFTQTLEQSPYRLDTFSVEQVTELCTFFPDILIDLICSQKPYTSFTGYVIFADVSGFTALCEKYATFGHSGAYHLTVTLNNYIGKMVSLIYSHGGDLIKFAGDALLAVWEFHYSEEIFVGMHKIVRCAMEIQNSLGHYQTDVGVLLKVKLSISLGSFLFATIGSKQNATYLLYGLPVLEVKKGEKYCSSGDTILSPAAWSLLDPMNYVYEEVKSGYVKVRAILYDPMKFQLPTRKTKNNRIPLLLKPWKLKEQYLEMLKDELSLVESMRPIILKPQLKEHVDVLRRFVITPVVHQIQKSSSAESLIEMRQVTILFLNIEPKDLAATKITLLANEVHRTVTKIIERNLGLINKICLFDKDLMLLILFGLKGYKGKDEASRTLQCGATIIDHISKFINVKSVSVGVTVGTTYCGVVGHPQRREYTVIGGAVNRAARLMVAFKNLVSCDLSVVFNSRLPIGYFERSKPVYLKGIGIIGNIFIYLGPRGNTVKTPLLGRYNIICKFVDMMAKTTPYQCLILRGDPRIGKSRILQEFVDVSELWGWNSLMVGVNQMNIKDICLVNKLISSFIGKTIKDRMRVLLDAASEEDLDHLHLLNKAFDVKFSVPHNYDKLLIYEDEPELYKRMLRKIFSHSVIVIDDAEDLDTESWRALCQLIRIPEIIVVCAIPRSYDLPDIYARQLISDHLSLTINIECLSVKYIGPLICQMLSADAVPYKLIKLLAKISHGNAGWIQTFLLSYVDSGTIIVMTEPSCQINQNIYMIPDPALVRTEFGNPFRSNYLPKDLQVCRLMDKSVDVNKVPPTFDDVIMATFDKLTPFEQLLLKCGAVLGKDFKRYALVYMMEFPSESAVCEAVEVLFKMDILGCVNVKTKRHFDENILAAQVPVAECHCDTVPLSRLSFPKYAFCEFICFKFSILASTIYQTIPINQRILFHTRALYSLKEQVRKCNECVHHEILTSIESRMDASNSETDSKSEYDTIADIKVTLEQLRRTDPYKEFKRKKNFSVRRGAIVTFDKISKNKINFGRRHGLPDTQFKLDLDALKDMAEKRQESLNVKVRRVVHKSSSRSFLRDLFNPSIEEENEDTFQMYIELKITELKYLVECAVHHSKYSQFQPALKLLLEARNLYQTCLNLLMKSKNGTKLAEGNDTLTLKDLQFEKKKIHCYLGKCYLSLGDLPKCSQELGQVASKSFLFGIEALINRLTLKTTIFKKKFVEKKRTDIALSSFVYIVLSDLYAMMFLFREASYTAKVAIRYALVLKKLTFMANAYAASIDADLLIGKLESSKKTEKEALNICLEVYSEKSYWDLLSLGKIYLAIFKGRTVRGEMVKAVEIGEALLNIAESFKAMDVLAYTYPAMLLILGYLHKLEKVKELLLKLKGTLGSAQAENDLREHLHIRMNMYVLIEVGYCMIPPNLLINQIRKSVDPKLIPVDRIICRRVAIYMWVWYLRRKDFVNAKIWEVTPYDNVDLCYENIPSSLMMLQGKLMYMSHIIQEGGTVNGIFLDEIKKRIKKLEHICKERMPIYLSRIYHLKAYKQILFATVLNKMTMGVIPGLREMNVALKYAKRCGNSHEITWINYSMNKWFTLGFIKLAGEAYRRNHYNYEVVEKDIIVKYEHDDILYDLPLPRRTVRRLKNVMLLTDYNYGGLHRRLWRILVEIFHKSQD
ncbi:adenylate cyclase type 10 isoform X3 [Halyomorpha halys]|uniref:adenylate cyclase type 10 isoform X3 n=1 Tax=Halyomorpha halys TaxID=286706 RepID=UPI0006D5221A|nr:adenylate cyclase type 10-like isoform X3 [Halyomorpha halys]